MATFHEQFLKCVKLSVQKILLIQNSTFSGSQDFERLVNFLNQHQYFIT